MLRRAFGLIAPVVAVVFLWGCASVDTDPPEWLNRTIAYDEAGVVAVVSGSGLSLIQAEFELQRAIQAFVIQILNDSVTRADVDPDPEAFDRVVRRRLARLGDRGLVILDDHTARPEGTVRRYALIRYETLALQQDVAALGSDGGIDSIEDMDYIQRANAVRVVQAAFGQTRTLPGADQVANAATMVQVTLSGIESTIQVGQARQLELRLAVGEIPIAGLPFVLNLAGPVVDGQAQRAQQRSISDADGVVAFTLPPIARVGNHQLTILPVVPNSVVAAGVAADPLIALMSVRTTLQATSRAASAPTAVLVQQVDLAGNLLDDQTATQAARREFAARGFLLADASVDRAVREQLLTAVPRSSLELYEILPFDVLSQANRVVVATMQINAFQESDNVSIEVGVAARAYDLRTNRSMPATAFDVRTTGSDGAATLAVAFQEAGRRLATRMATELP